MDTFILNSFSYSDKEIEELLHLKLPYSLSDVDRSKNILMQQLSNNNNLGISNQKEIFNFIDSITNRIKSKVENPYADVHNVIHEGNNFIIENPDRIIGKKSQIEKGRIAIDSQAVPPGYMNPINVRTITQAISIDSRFRPNYAISKSTNFDIILPSIQKNVVSMRVTSIELPMTYYAVSRYNGNSTCTIIDLSNNGTVGWVLTLPDGNYEQSWAHNSHAAHIESAMNNAILAARPVSIDVNNGRVTDDPSGVNLTANDFVFNVDHISGKSFFKAIAGGILETNGFSIRFNVDITGNLSSDANIQLRLGWQLGFRKDDYTINNLSCISEGICLVCGPRYGFISIDDYQKNTGPAYMIAYNNSVLQDNIITRINLAELQADVGVYQSSSDPGLRTQLNRTREYFGPVDIQRLHISLFDEFGRIIDLNHMDWSLSLNFESVYN